MNLEKILSNVSIDTIIYAKTIHQRIVRQIAWRQSGCSEWPRFLADQGGIARDAAMSIFEANQQLIDQFNSDEQIWRRPRLRRLERRLNHPNPGAMHHDVLDMLAEMGERKDVSIVSTVRSKD